MSTHQDKLRAAVHFICRYYSTDKDKLGLTKLHKSLWYADTRSFRMTGETITGEKYFRYEHGPYMRALEGMLEKLESEGVLRIGTVEFHGLPKKEFVARGDPDMSVFSESEKRWIEESMKMACEGHTATSISEKSHDVIWKMALPFEEIPMYATLLTKLAPMTDDDVAWAQEQLAD
jgi:hypothetical protein